MKKLAWMRAASAFLTFAAAAFLFPAAAISADSKEIGFVETFALAPDRTVVLEQLIPGTEDYYYYQALHAQNRGDLKRVDELLKPWLKRYGRTPQLREMQHRQALLGYEKSPGPALEYLRRELGLKFNHQQERVGEKPDLPIELDPQKISRETLLKEAFRRSKNLDGLSDTALDWIIRDEVPLDHIRRRHLLEALEWPDYPNLPEMVAADLATKESGGFGSLGIHERLLRNQLERLLELRPELIANSNYVNTYLTKLQPGDDIDWRRDAATREAYLDEMWHFVKGLQPAFGSLQAHVLYQLLDHHRREGEYPRDLFFAYLALPRTVSYLNPRMLEEPNAQRYRADLGADFREVTGCPPIRDEEPLVREYLMQYFVKERDIRGFAPYLRDTYLEPVFAETKLVNGIGDPEKWFSMMTPGAVQALKERVDLEFASTNSSEFDPGDEVALDLEVKNVRHLLVKVYEVNAMNYYIDHGSEINTSLNLDGLVANEEFSVDYSDPPLRRVRRTFTFDQLKGKRGVWIVEFIGNGRASRALIKQGRLQYLAKTTAAGHLIRVLTEANVPAKDPAVWLAGRKYSPGKKGNIIVPFSNAPGDRKIVLTEGPLATLETLAHESESYDLAAGFYVDREGLLPGKEAEVAVRPTFFINDEPAAIDLLEEVRLTITSTDLEGVSATDVVENFALFGDRESIYVFRVPERLRSLEFSLTAKVQNLSRGEREEVGDSDSFDVNGIDETEHTADLYLTKIDGEYVLELLGKTGEGLVDRPVQIELQPRDFSFSVRVSLKTAEGGQVILGSLKGIESLSASGAEFPVRDWELFPEFTYYPEVIHAAEGDVIRLPAFVRGKKLTPSDLALLETRAGTPVADRFGAVTLKDGFYEIAGLAAGDYEMLLRDFDLEMLLSVSQGEKRLGHVLSRFRHLELGDESPLHLAPIEVTKDQVTIRVENANASTRVHAVATRFAQDFPLAFYLGDENREELSVIDRGTADTRYVSGRDIGEEYRYILDRRVATKFPGNMLERPGLLLNPWAVRETQTETDDAEGGEQWKKSMEDTMARRGAGAAGRKKAMEAAAGEAGSSNLNFLAENAPISFNLVPDKNGVITLERKALGNRQHLHVIALDPKHTVFREVSLAATGGFAVRDTRLAKALDPQKHFAEQQKVTVLQPGETLVIEDPRSARFETYGSVADVYGVLSAMSGDDTLAKFGFILEWPSLPVERKRERYSEYACHELNVFLARKDAEFFAEVVQPYLRNKKEPRFIDDLLGSTDLTGYLEPWSHGQLNIVERVLLGQRLGGDAFSSARRHVQDLFDLVPRDAAREQFGFVSALRGRGLARDSVSYLMITEAIDESAPMDAFGAAPKARGMAALELGGTHVRQLEMQKAQPGGAEALTAAMQPATPMAALAPQRLAEAKDGLDLVMDKRRRQLPALAEGEIEELQRVSGARRELRQLFRKLEKTKEYAENNYYHLPIAEQGPRLVAANAFWRDYGAWDGSGSFYSEHFTSTPNSFAEMMLALAALDLPFEAKKHDIGAEDGKLIFKAASPVIVFHQEVQEVETAAEKTPILVSQNFFRHGDRYEMEGNEKVDKFVTEEFLAGVVYGCQVVITNPTAATQKLELLLQVPEKSIPLLGSEYTRTANVDLEPYSTARIEYHFYFPAPSGKTPYPHQPVQVSKDEKLIAWAEPFTFNVVERLSQIDKASWDYVSQFATNAEVLAYLDQNNVERLDLSKIAWRVRESDGFLREVTKKLDGRYKYDPVLWSYGLYHNFLPLARQYLLHANGFLAQCGDYLDCSLVTIDPVARRQLEFLEYKPLVNARAHRLGSERTILNNLFREQYQRYLRFLGHRRDLTDEDRLGVVHYLFLQDRVGEALEFLDEINAGNLDERLQFDYLRAYAAMYREQPGEAAKIALAYRDHPVDKWRERFAEVARQVRGITGEPDAPENLDPEDREATQQRLADTEPAFEFEVARQEVTLRYRNLDEVRVNYYAMDLELLFSSNPFVGGEAGRFSVIRPNRTELKKLPGGKTELVFAVPEEFANENVLIEIVGAGQKSAKPAYANDLDLQLAENYGRLQVRRDSSDKPLSKVYVKVYARYPGGAVKFVKDGYTDLRGKFDYASLSTDELDAAERVSLLVMSEEHGSLVREAAPPKR